MGIFRGFKRSGEVTDYARGAPAPKKTVGFTQDGFVDFSKSESELNNTSENISSSTSSPVKSSGSVFDFLTGGSSSSDNNSVGNPSSRDLPPPYIGDNYGGSELDEVKKMIRNVSGMTSDNSNEVYKLLQRIELLERKLERLEGKE